MKKGHYFKTDGGILTGRLENRRKLWGWGRGIRNFTLESDAKESDLDDFPKPDKDRPSVVLILCKTENGIIAEYSLSDLSKPNNKM